MSELNKDLSYDPTLDIAFTPEDPRYLVAYRQDLHYLMQSIHSKNYVSFERKAAHVIDAMYTLPWGSQPNSGKAILGNFGRTDEVTRQLKYQHLPTCDPLQLRARPGTIPKPDPNHPTSHGDHVRVVDVPYAALGRGRVAQPLLEFMQAVERSPTVPHYHGLLYWHLDKEAENDNEEAAMIFVGRVTHLVHLQARFDELLDVFLDGVGSTRFGSKNEVMARRQAKLRDEYLWEWGAPSKDKNLSELGRTTPKEPALVRIKEE